MLILAITLKGEIPRVKPELIGIAGWESRGEKNGDG